MTPRRWAFAYAAAAAGAAALGALTAAAIVTLEERTSRRWESDDQAGESLNFPVWPASPAITTEGTST